MVPVIVLVPEIGVTSWIVTGMVSVMVLVPVMDVGSMIWPVSGEVSTNEITVPRDPEPVNFFRESETPPSKSLDAFRLVSLRLKNGLLISPSYSSEYTRPLHT